MKQARKGQESAKIENLKRGEYGVVEQKNGYVLEKRSDPANGLTYYVVYDEKRTRMWTHEEAPWDFRKATRILNDSAAANIPAGAKVEKFSFL